ncbi:hypothetical protein IMSAGC012_01212 [Lachnospiraceae bacterium]|nr:hypothetical protein IMSAGC012_01212 [Lachnospiraceae bacterium]
MGLFDKKKEKEYSSIIHIEGLNVPENCRCKILLGKTHLTVFCAGNEFSLNYEQIKNIDCQRERDEKLFQKSSLSKTIVGAAAFGATGAIVGAVPKTKSKREIISYAIISFVNSHGEYQNMVFRDEFPNTAKCTGVVDKLRAKVKTQVNRVQL